MANAKEDFLDEVKNKPRVKCAIIKYGGYSEDNSKVMGTLKTGYSDDDYRSFLKSIDFQYHSGFGVQELYGIIWYEDGTWSERGEYDGSEWWEYKSMPEIPKALV